MAALGQIPTNSLGIEFTGEVVRCGPECTRIRPGMRVAVAKKASFSTYFVVHEGRCAELPTDLDLAPAASLPTVFQTAYVSLTTYGRLQKGETGCCLETKSGSTR